MNKEAQGAEAEKFVSAKLPVDRSLIRSGRLLNMIEVVEVLPAPDRNRTLWQLLVDAGADVDHIVYRDAEDERPGGRGPALQFRVDTSKLKGFLVIEVAEVERGFRLLMQNQECSVLQTAIECVFLRDLPEKVASLIDDGTRRWNDAVRRHIVT
ncbi:hypothetical protein [Ralstonia pseudosolanacearum]|uniref:hypothetical protein n=1 Tax=Ralstonia pseudosolanacearum TaxID=1310165 RepID=UPI003CED99FC